MPTINKKSKKRPWLKRQSWGSSKSRSHRKDQIDFYNSHKWRSKARKHKVKYPLCEVCKLNNIIRAVEVTDHVIPVELGGDPFDDLNLRSLCHSDHNSKSAREKNRPIYRSEVNGNGLLIPRYPLQEI